jgi:type II secretory pathway pseudopilin PulG
MTRDIAGRARAERGFTLAAVLVILTIIAIVIANTVPQVWSDLMHRQRDIQTIWVMKQYARAIQGFQTAHGAPPTKLDDLKRQTKPRVLRQLYPDPLTGKMDWILVPVGSVTVTGTVTGTVTDTSETSPKTQTTQNSSADYVGPFIGVRPPVTGKSIVPFRGMGRYDQWSYTVNDLAADSQQQVQQ